MAELCLQLSGRVYEQELDTTVPLPGFYCTESGSKCHQNNTGAHFSDVVSAKLDEVVMQARI